MAVREMHAHPQHGSHGDTEQGVKDPVCGMTVDPYTAKHRSTHEGRTYYFCSAKCREKFEANPEQYLEHELKSAAPVPKGTIYTCPMHPQIRQVGPGSCPICGMALEPELVSADANSQSRACRHDASVLDWTLFGVAGVRARDGRPPHRA